MPTQEDTHLELSWSDEGADALAIRMFEHDPFHGTKDAVAPSLLSATDIVAYVKETAMVTPFMATKQKLKHASYEACIGKNTYFFGKRGIEKIPLTEDGFLRVPKNEIVFVESELTFRLPRYIAARFNLQIKHVHRGLLLGTGPLVDPGFRGRLLIPLHNLTSEDYYIHKDDGFIWIEFTRTTYNQDRPEPFGDYPDYKQIADGKKWLHKASFNDHLQSEVPIRSSITPIVDSVQKTANKAKKKATQVQRTAYVGGLALLLTFGLIMLTEIYTNRSFMQSAYNAAIDKKENGAGLLDTIIQDTKRFMRDIGVLAGEIDQLRKEVSDNARDLRSQIESLKAENASLRDAIRDGSALSPPKKLPSRQ